MSSIEFSSQTIRCGNALRELAATTQNDMVSIYEGESQRFVSQGQRRRRSARRISRLIDEAKMPATKRRYRHSGDAAASGRLLDPTHRKYAQVGRTRANERKTRNGKKGDDQKR